MLGPAGSRAAAKPCSRLPDTSLASCTTRPDPRGLSSVIWGRSGWKTILGYCQKVQNQVPVQSREERISSLGSPRESFLGCSSIWGQAGRIVAVLSLLLPQNQAIRPAQRYFHGKLLLQEVFCLCSGGLNALGQSADSLLRWERATCLPKTQGGGSWGGWRERRTGSHSHKLPHGKEAGGKTANRHQDMIKNGILQGASKQNPAQPSPFCEQHRPRALGRVGSV